MINLQFIQFIYRYLWLLSSIFFLALGGVVQKQSNTLKNFQWQSREFALYNKIIDLPKDDLRALNIMARTVYGETRNQKVKSAHDAVAHVILNRSKNKRTISDVVYKRKQFTCWEKTDHNRDVVLSACLSEKAFQRSLYACVRTLKGNTDITKGANHYHAKYTRPYWIKSKRLKPVGRFGDHIFYKKC
ncbi:MAG: cell wall hydrolase [Alphaproteobacteria bacterium]|nr:cell wall hydrolase [Alphaproteobacteria bacterium]